MSADVKARERELRERLWRAIEFVQTSDFFIHDETLEVVTSRGRLKVPKITTLCVVNALVCRGTCLLRGGYGGGKTTLVKILGRMLTGASLRDIEDSMLRANPELTEEKILARLELGKLVKEGREVVIWRNFTRAFWKIIDEVNRLSPSAQDALLSLIGEGRARYFGEVYECRDFVLFATLNPRDVGAFELGLPFLDRFGVCLDVSSPLADEYAEIAEARDKSLFEESDATIPVFLTERDLKLAWLLAARVPLSTEARLFVSVLARELSFCERAKKELGTLLERGHHVCAGCKYDMPDSICNKTLTPLSPRAVKDIVRYSRALAWLLGLDSVELGVVVALAPYIIWHRLAWSQRVLEEHGLNPLAAARRVVDLALRAFMRRLPILRLYDSLLVGDAGEESVLQIREAARGDPIIAELATVAEALVERNWPALALKLRAAVESGDEARAEEVVREIRGFPADIRYRALRAAERIARSKLRTLVTTVERALAIAKAIPELGEAVSVAQLGRVLRWRVGAWTFIEISMQDPTCADSLAFVDVYGVRADEVAKRVEKLAG